MKKKETDWSSQLNWLMIAIAVFATYIQIFPPRNSIDQVRAGIYFLAIIIFVPIAFLLNFAWAKANIYIKQIKDNEKEIETIKSSLELEKRFYEMDKRLALLENVPKRRKGEIDIKWIILAVLLILLFLYLRAVGIIKW